MRTVRSVTVTIRSAVVVSTSNQFSNPSDDVTSQRTMTIPAAAHTTTAAADDLVALFKASQAEHDSLRHEHAATHDCPGANKEGGVTRKNG